MSNILLNLETITKNYLIKIKNLTNEGAIDALMQTRARTKLSFWQSLSADTGVERAIKTLLQIQMWQRQGKSDNLEIIQLVFNYLQSNMGTSLHLNLALTEYLAKAVGLNLQPIAPKNTDLDPCALLTTNPVAAYSQDLLGRISDKLSELNHKANPPEVVYPFII